MRLADLHQKLKSRNSKPIRVWARKINVANPVAVADRAYEDQARLVDGVHASTQTTDVTDVGEVKSAVGLRVRDPEYWHRTVARCRRYIGGCVGWSGARSR